MLLTRFLKLTLSISLLNTVGYSQLIIDNSKTPDELVDQVLLGIGVTAFNITYSGVSAAIGEFDGANSNIGLDGGIIMASGPISIAVGPNNQENAAVNVTSGGDIDLTSISGKPTEDAAILEFDFVAEADTVRFRYVFGSEEYDEYVCTNFNDAFGFFISGPGIAGKINLAVLPGNSDPISISTVNNGTVGSEVSNPMIGPGSICELGNSLYYISNAGGTTIQYDGFTTVLEAVAAVIPCDTFHIKLAISDTQDGLYDSGVFIEGGSFTALPVEVHALGATGDSLIAEGCDSAMIVFTRIGDLNANMTIKFIVDGSATNGDDYTLIPDSIIFPPGEDTVILSILPFLDGNFEGQENIILTIEQYALCDSLISSLTTTLLIDDVNPIKLSVNEDDTICVGENMVLTAEASGGGGGLYYLWSNGEITSSISVNPVVNTNYTVSVNDRCDFFNASDDVNVIMRCPTVIPNVFTANDDGLNDQFRIQYLEHYPLSELHIYNRWGRRIYKNENYLNDWNGTKGNSDVSEGVYYYILYRSDEKTFTGYFQLMR